MLSYIWPIALVVLSNTIYQICSKSIPGSINPFASLTVTYMVAAVCAGILYAVMGKDVNLLREYSHLNWASFALGVSIVGLEVGFIFAYKAGWPVSTAATVQSAFLAIALMVAGLLFFHEAITWNKVVGIVICLIGLAFLNH